MTTKLEQAAREVIRQHSMECLSDKAVDSLREALAEQAEQEPVAWKDMAFARLGVVRDKMRPEDVEVVQRFLDGVYAAPVRTKDLTDDEISVVFLNSREPLNEWSFARAVIAADRKLNKQTKENQE